MFQFVQFAKSVGDKDTILARKKRSLNRRSKENKEPKEKHIEHAL